MANKKRLTAAIDKILQEKKSTENEQLSIDEIRGFFEKNGKEYGLPPIEVNEAVALLYDAVFTDIGKNKTAVKMDDEFRNFVKDILQKFAEELEINPVYYDFEYWGSGCQSLTSLRHFNFNSHMKLWTHHSIKETLEKYNLALAYTNAISIMQVQIWGLCVVW